ncbi:hypothetical protein T439DRAFT_296083 [Meredithblackwellia eburnea MCA 4105]
MGTTPSTKMAQERPNVNVIPLDIVDPPTQRLYLVSAFILAQAAKLPDAFFPASTGSSSLITTGVDEDQFNYFLVKWILLDCAIVFIAKQLRVPRFDWSLRRWSILLAALFVVDWLIFGRWKFSASIFLPSFVKAIFLTYLSTTERSVRLSNVVGPEAAHLGGHYTVHILAVSTAQLNPSSQCFCLPITSSPEPILVPLLLNNTVPSRLTYSVTSFTDPSKNQTYTVSASSLLHPLPIHDSAGALPDADEVDRWVLGDDAKTPTPLLTQNPQIALHHRLPSASSPASPDDPFALSPTESLYYLPVTQIGIIRLDSIWDSEGLPVRVRRRRTPSSTPGGRGAAEEQGTRIVSCPRAGFSTDDKVIHTCANPSVPQSKSLELTVQGYEPIKVSWHHGTVVVGPKGSRKVSKREQVQGITDALAGVGLTAPLPVPVNVTMADVGRQTFVLDRVEDGCGNVVDFAGVAVEDGLGGPEGAAERRREKKALEAKLLPQSLGHREFIVHAVPEVAYVGACGLGEEVTLLKGGKKRLDFKLSSLDKDGGPWTIDIRYRGEDGKVKGTRQVQADRATAGFEVEQAGTYEIVGVRGQWCEGAVLVPSICTVVEQPQPTLSATFETLRDVCSSDIGVISTLHLTGVPPFTVTYLLTQLSPTKSRREVKKAFAGSRGEIRIEPGPGEWEYRFTKVQDAFYRDIPVTVPAGEEQPVMKQTVQLVGGAQWRNAAQGKTVHSCDGETVTVAVDFKGSAPWELEYAVIGSPAQTIKDITNPHFSMDVAIPPLIAKRGGKFGLSLESVRDGHGCKRPLTSQDLWVDVRRTKPTARWPGTKGSRGAVIRDQGDAKIPLRLTGEGPWTITYQPPTPPSAKNAPAPLNFVANQPNVDMNLRGPRPGVYTLLSVRDQFCPGDVEDTDWTISTLPRPTLRYSDDAGKLVRNGSLVRRPVCENTLDTVDVIFSGKPPFTGSYLLRKGSHHSEQLHRTLPAIQPRAELTLFTGEAGHHTYQFTGVGDALYDTPDKAGLLTPSEGREGLVRLEQDVFALPDASFKHGAKRGFCIKDSLASRGSEDLIVQLTGEPPFALELDVREEGHRSSQRFTVPNIVRREWAVQLPVELSSAASYIVSIRRVSDAHGCSRRLDHTATSSSVSLPVAEIASITPVLPQEAHCVGDFLDFVLQGAPPFTVVYEFADKQHTVPLSSSKFSRIAAAPGLFKIISVGHGEDQCKSKSVDLVKKVYPLPTAQVSEGQDVFVDIREGDQTEIIFSFTGEPPFTFTYSRRHPQDRTKDKTVLETHTVTGIMENTYSIFTSQEGTWSVSYVSDAHCSFPSATAGREDK